LNLKEAQVKQLLNFLNKNYLNAQRASGNASTTLPTIYYISEEQARRFFNWLDRQPPASAGNGSRAPMRSQPLLVGAHANGRNSNSNGAGQTRAVSGNGGAKPITLSYENGGSGARLESLILPEKLLQIHLSPKIIHFRIRRYDADAGGLVKLPPPANEFAPHAMKLFQKADSCLSLASQDDLYKFLIELHGKYRQSGGAGISALDVSLAFSTLANLAHVFSLLRKVSSEAKVAAFSSALKLFRASLANVLPSGEFNSQNIRKIILDPSGWFEGDNGVMGDSVGSAITGILRERLFAGDFKGASSLAFFLGGAYYCSTNNGYFALNNAARDLIASGIAADASEFFKHGQQADQGKSTTATAVRKPDSDE